ncbi:lipoyl(octanoyl) transferase LipB [Orrella sp. 11846]|uniref:lipoyl(octanoyl) transferase LipB n=1 Tax=Orrella sp. 11846 TaxID=3409913 RepID=UPI003B5A0210
MTIQRLATDQAGVWRIPGLAPYETIWQAMRDQTEVRTPQSLDEIWLVEHLPVYTLGVAGKPEHVLNAGQIPLVRSDRGGQVTYHGPGQVVAYVLCDLRRVGIAVREFVVCLEDAVLQTLADFGLTRATRLAGAPGIYWPLENGELAKIAALGLKVRKGCTYHGVSLNVDMDLSPFDGINPCGYAGMPTIDMRRLGMSADWETVAMSLTGHLQKICQLKVE